MRMNDRECVSGVSEHCHHVMLVDGFAEVWTAAKLI